MSWLTNSYKNTASPPKPSSDEELRAFIQAAGKDDRAVMTAFIAKYPHMIDAASFIPMSSKRNALYHAIACQKTGAVEFLLQHGASTKRAEGVDKPPLALAANNSQLATVALLLKHGALVDELSDQGGTALMYAVRVHHVEIVKLLLEKGAQADIPNYASETALSFGKRTLTASRNVQITAQQREQEEAVLNLLTQWETRKKEAAEKAAKDAVDKAQHDLAVEKQKRLKEMARQHHFKLRQ
jgi:hypothetical protein